jgi:hypothetical protein
MSCRNLTSTSSIFLANVTLLLPPAEAAQLAAAAASAVTAANGNADQALLSMVYPTAVGPLAVLYRSIQISNAPPATAAAAAAGRRHLLQITGPPTVELLSVVTRNRSIQLLQLPASATEAAAGSGSRQLLQTAAAAAAGPGTVCIGSMQGLGLSGRNVCFVPQQAGDALPPGKPCAVSAKF